MINILISNPITFFFYLFALFFAITIHEFSHAWAADRLGDPTPRIEGRLKLNPLTHIDPFGLLFLLFFGFGWGKPVNIDPFNLKNPRRDSALISLAGPLSNFILALLISFSLKLLIFFNLYFLTSIGYLFLVPLITFNVILGLFNLLPIYPLDGFKIVGGILPENKSQEWYQLKKYGIIFLLMLIFPFGKSSMLDMIIRPIFSFIISILIPNNITGALI